MSTPDRSAQQRYSAGSCRLEVTLRLSALSQWYAQPVTEDLAFQLWLQSPERTFERTLVAQGDRAALQAIADYIQQKVQSTLAIAQISRSSALSAIAADPLSQPSTLQLAQPLSYLQLCDLSTVLSQYQQATKTLPVSLSPAVASTQSSPTSPSPPSQIISFPLSRRANPSTRFSRSKIWASSAAAAVFAVGLTATLWPNISSQVDQPDADSTLIEPIKPNAVLKPEASTPPTGQSLTPEPESGSAKRPETRLDTRSGTAANSVDPAPTAPNSNPAPAALPRNRAANRNASGDLAPAVTAPSSAPAAGARSAKAPTANNSLPDNSQPVNPSIARPPLVATEPESDPSSAPSSAPSSDNLADATNAESSENAAASSTARLSARSSTADVIAQVQSYFHSQWQAIRSADRLALQAPLVYRLQISETGEVVSFTALDEQAQRWRDRLFFANNPPTFSAMTAASDQQNSSNLVLRLTVTTEGQIQVSEF